MSEQERININPPFIEVWMWEGQYILPTYDMTTVLQIQYNDPGACQHAIQKAYVKSF